MTKVLMVLTSHADLGDTGRKTGFYLPEVAHPWEVFTEAGYDVDFVSPKGGEAPMDGVDLSDPIQQAFLGQASFMHHDVTWQGVAWTAVSGVRAP